MSDSFHQIADSIDSAGSIVIDLQAKLVAIPAIGPQNGGTGEWPKARVLCEFLDGLGFPPPVVFPAPDRSVPEGSRPNLLYRLPGRLAGPTRWMISHLDVVPAGERWSRDPFSLHVEGDHMFGRGVLDNHQGIISSILAFQALLRAGVSHYPLAMLFVSDEETGSTHGLQHLLDAHNLFAAGDLLIVPDAGDPDSRMIEVAEKAVLWLKVETHGRQTHASRPGTGVNALAAASLLIARMEALYRHFPAIDPLFDPPYSTFECTKKPSNNVGSINIIPGHDLFYADCRLLPSCDPQAVMAAMAALARTVEQDFAAARREGHLPLSISVSIESLGPAAPATSSDAPVIRALQSAIKDVYRVDARPMGIGGATVAALLRGRGFPAAVWATMDPVAHQPDEYSRISHTLNDAKVFAHLCMHDA